MQLLKFPCLTIGRRATTAPRAVVEVPIPDDGSTGSGAEVDTETTSMVSGDEEVNQGEENESWEDDDEEEVDS